jgi:NADH:ubiquinone oxidoreductase subunit E
MCNNAKDLLAIGWDVAGWKGEQVFSAVAIEGGQSNEGRQLNCKGIYANKFNNGEDEIPCLESLLPKLNCSKMSDYDRIIIAVDAPLGWPAAFQRFVQQPMHQAGEQASTAYEALKYRQTDRYIADIHPNIDAVLSASFDTMTSLTTVAITALKKWRTAKELTVMPHDGPGEPKKGVAIEVYPGLVKGQGKVVEAYRKAFQEQLWPDKSAQISIHGGNYRAMAAQAIKSVFENIYHQKNPKSNQNRRATDVCDALICALMGLGYQLGHQASDVGLPPLSTTDDIPPELRELARQEGWIFYPRA